MIIIFIYIVQKEEYKKMVKEAAEEESEDEDEGWLTFDNSTTDNPFKTTAPPMLQAPHSMQWNQPQIPNTKVVPMWAQSQHSMPVMQPVQAWNQDVMAAVGGFQPPANTNMFAPPQNMFAPPQNMFAPPQNMFAPPIPACKPWSPEDGFRPVSPSYNPDRPDSPVYDPNKSYGADSPVYDPNKSYDVAPTSPEYDPNGPTTPPYSPTSPEYTPPPSPTSPEYDEENDDVYNPMAGYGAEN